MQLFQVDAFTSTPFAGNPAGVCLLTREAKADWMQSIAAEMNLAETAFLRPRDGGGFEIRYFTPTTEVPICGHATLASAHVLYECALLKRNEAAMFHCEAGELSAQWKDGWIAMDFPTWAVTASTDENVITSILGATAAAVYTTENGWHMAVMASEADVLAVNPDLQRLLASHVDALLVTGPGSAPDVDYVLRFFAPRHGINEDPVTGSAQCALGPYWGAKLNKTSMNARQVSARRGVLRVAVQSDRNRVQIEGQAVTLFRLEYTGHVPLP